MVLIFILKVISHPLGNVECTHDLIDHCVSWCDLPTGEFLLDHMRELLARS